MKEIKAIIQPFMLSHVLDALHAIEGLPGVTVSEVRSIDLERGSVQQVTNVKLELMVADEQAQMVVQAIHKHAHTGNSGDGRIFVIPIEETVKIRAVEPLNLRTKEKNDE